MSAAITKSSMEHSACQYATQKKQCEKDSTIQKIITIAEAILTILFFPIAIAGAGIMLAGAACIVAGAVLTPFIALEGGLTLLKVHAFSWENVLGFALAGLAVKLIVCS